MNAFLWFLLPMTFMVFIFGIDSLERKRKGNKTMSRFLKEMIGKKPTFGLSSFRRSGGF